MKLILFSTDIGVAAIFKLDFGAMARAATLHTYTINRAKTAAGKDTCAEGGNPIEEKTQYRICAKKQPHKNAR